MQLCWIVSALLCAMGDNEDAKNLSGDKTGLVLKVHSYRRCNVKLEEKVTATKALELSSFQEISVVAG